MRHYPSRENKQPRYKPGASLRRKLNWLYWRRPKGREISGPAYWAVWNSWYFDGMELDEFIEMIGCDDILDRVDGLGPKRLAELRRAFLDRAVL